jgi:peptidoglycan/LPS O-acetylase OafA/YrhL
VLAGVRIPYRPELDGLRGVAILLVLGHHLIVGEGRVLPGGFVGVDVFFVLSGALITTLLLREHAATGTVDLGAFYLRRATRLLPALAAMLAFCAIFTWLRWPEAEAREVRLDAVYALLYLSSFINVTRPLRLLSTTWSLSIEEWFYIAWPLALRALARTAKAGLRPVALALALVVVACGAWRVELEEVALAPFRRIYFGLDTRADALAFGGLVAVALAAGWPRSEPLLRWAARAGVLVLAAAAVWADWRTPAYSVAGYTVVAAAAAPVVLSAMRQPSRWLAARPLVWTGKLSYSLYLWLLPVLTFLQRQPWALRVVVLFAASAASYRLVELPGVRARRFFAPRRAS